MAVTENFNTNENPLSSSGKWVSGPGSYANVQALNGKLQGVTLDVYGAAALAPAPPGEAVGADQYAQLLINTADVATNGIGVAVRIKSTTDGGSYILLVFPTGVRISRVDDDGATLTATALGTDFAAPAAGTHTYRLEISGSTLTYKLDGVSQGTRTDATYTAGQPGPITFHTGVEGDDFEGGSMPDPSPFASVVF